MDTQIISMTFSLIIITIWVYYKVPVNGDSVVADYDLKLGNIDVDLDGLGPLQVQIKDKIKDKIKDVKKDKISDNTNWATLMLTWTALARFRCR